jgi:hypothetical protein
VKQNVTNKLLQQYKNREDLDMKMMFIRFYIGDNVVSFMEEEPILNVEEGKGLFFETMLVQNTDYKGEFKNLCHFEDDE